MAKEKDRIEYRAVPFGEVRQATVVAVERRGCGDRILLLSDGHWCRDDIAPVVTDVIRVLPRDAPPLVVTFPEGVWRVAALDCEAATDTNHALLRAALDVVVERFLEQLDPELVEALESRLDGSTLETVLGMMAADDADKAEFGWAEVLFRYENREATDGE